MTDDAVLILVWSHKGETLVIPAVDSEGDDNILMTMLVDKLPERVKDTAEAAVLRGTIADLRGVVTKLRLAVLEAGKMAAYVNELEREQLQPVEAS